MLMVRQLYSPFPPYVLSVVVCWASALFLGNGLVAATNALTMLAHLAGATAIASAIFLILELSQPYSSISRSAMKSWPTSTKGSSRRPTRCGPHSRRTDGSGWRK